MIRALRRGRSFRALSIGSSQLTTGHGQVAFGAGRQRGLRPMCRRPVRPPSNRAGFAETILTSAVVVLRQRAPGGNLYQRLLSERSSTEDEHEYEYEYEYEYE